MGEYKRAPGEEPRAALPPIKAADVNGAAIRIDRLIDELERAVDGREITPEQARRVASIFLPG